MLTLRNGKKQKIDYPQDEPEGNKLKQLRYNAYSEDIIIYHYPEDHLSVKKLRYQMNREKHGYVETLMSFDPIYRLKDSMPEGDEPPSGHIEVAYLPKVFQHDGSALGFRLGSDIVHWMCFNRSVDESILNKMEAVQPYTKKRLTLFDHVATLSRPSSEPGDTNSSGQEHRFWHNSLLKAKHRPLKLKLTWRSFHEDESMALASSMLESRQEEETKLERGDLIVRFRHGSHVPKEKRA